jgi:hypothetical protein
LDRGEATPPKGSRIIAIIQNETCNSLKASEDDADAQEIDCEQKCSEKAHMGASEDQEEDDCAINQEDYEDYSDEEVIRHDYYSDDILFENDGSQEEEEEDEVPPVETPEWFSFEDGEQMKIIFDSYSQVIKIPDDNKKAIREPPVSFIWFCSLTF